jgi:four helix bundle protein
MTAHAGKRKNCVVRSPTVRFIQQTRAAYLMRSHRRMSDIRLFRDLLVWQKSMDLAVRCYRTAQGLPRSEQQVLGYQLRKSSVSMPSNVAEGFGRHSTAHYIQHLWTAHASGAELETQAEVVCRLELVTSQLAEVLIRDAQEVGRMLNGLVRSLERPEHTRSR